MRIPVAIYRIQFTPTFGFNHCREIVPYLADLGISDLYASPIFKAVPGSPHGYDVVDPNQLNPELGTADDFEKLALEVEANRMGWLQDIVPNHMAFHGSNAMLMDIFESGPSSLYFDFFDVEWNHPYESIRGRLLAPFLGKFFGESLESGEIQLHYDENGFSVVYYKLRYPLKIESYVNILTHRIGALKRELGADHLDYIKLLGVLYVLKNLPPKEELSERQDQIRFIKSTLWELHSKNARIKEFFEQNIAVFNGEQGRPESFNLLETLLAEQWFRLAFWKVASEEINYRRFFNINQLISVRAEDERVFLHTHDLIFKLIEKKRFTGLRIDHIDGLHDPATYLERLRQRAGDIYLTVEKILGFEEDLPRNWPVAGTTGYNFLNIVNGVFCRSEYEEAFSELYRNFTGFDVPYADLVIEKKRLIIGRHMAGYVDNLVLLLKSNLSRHRHGSDATPYGLKRAFVEVLAAFPVYRSYVSFDNFSEEDRAHIKIAIERASQSFPGLAHELNLIEHFLLLEGGERLSPEERRNWIHFAMRFQQLTGPLMAKGFEDTTLYVYNRLLSLNEVGGKPDHFGIAIEKFHQFNQSRAEKWPHEMSATASHDTKRGEDMRGRINVLSEIPEEWDRQLRQWRKLNQSKKTVLKPAEVPALNDEYFLYQTLVGAFPFDEHELPEFIERIKKYVIKAVREAKVHTAWLKPDSNYENAFLAFVDATLQPAADNSFLKKFLPFQRKVAHYGVFNSLSQTLLKIASPGVPDFYQGAELWDLSLVDPDNRRPVDYARRQEYLRQIKMKEEAHLTGFISELLATKENGMIKLFLIWRAMQARALLVQLFQQGSCVPIEVSGVHKNHVIAFARRHENSWALCIVPRFLASLVKAGELPLGEKVWDDTRVILPSQAPSRWRDAFSELGISAEKSIAIGEILAHFPAALLINED